MPASPAAARLALVSVLAAVLASCSLSAVSGPRTWTQTVETAGGEKQEVTVRDESGRLTNVEINPQGVAPSGEIANPPGEPNVVLVPWEGGACDTRTEFVFRSAGQGLDGTFSTTTSGEVCTMLAIQHQLRLTSNAPLPAAQVTLNRAP